jgi:hypothetical protein
MRLHEGVRAARALATALFLTALTVGAHAQITFNEHAPGALQPPENVLMDSASGFNVFGHTNQTNTGVIFTSDEDIIAPAQGQARVEATDDGYKTLCIELAPGFGFRAIEFDVNVFDRAGDGTIQIEVFGIGAGVPVVFNSTVDANGSNWFSLQAGAASMMTKICITTNVDIQDTRQWRLGGIGELQVVPEGSSLALLGTGLLPLIGFAIRRRRSRAL